MMSAAEVQSIDNEVRALFVSIKDDISFIVQQKQQQHSSVAKKNAENNAEKDKKRYMSDDRGGDNADMDAKMQQKLSHLKNKIRRLEIEALNLNNRSIIRKYKIRVREYNRDLKVCEKKVNGKKSANTAAVVDGNVVKIEMTMTEQQCIEYGRSLLNENDRLADNILHDLQATKHVAVDTLETVNNQTNQIANIDRDLSKIDNELQKSKVVIRRMARRVMTDKYIWCLVMLICIAVVVMILFKVFNIQKL